MDLITAAELRQGLQWKARIPVLWKSTGSGLGMESPAGAQISLRDWQPDAEVIFVTPGYLMLRVLRSIEQHLF